MVTIIRLRYASDIVTGARQEEMKQALTMEDAVDAILFVQGLQPFIGS